MNIQIKSLKTLNTLKDIKGLDRSRDNPGGLLNVCKDIAIA